MWLHVTFWAEVEIGGFKVLGFQHEQFSEGCASQYPASILIGFIGAPCLGDP